MRTNKQERMALAMAKVTQQAYDNIGASSYQSIRNPYPMHQLVQAALPKSKRRALSVVDIAASLELAGYVAKVQSVRVGLSKLGTAVASFRTQPRLSWQRGAPIKRYFYVGVSS